MAEFTELLAGCLSGIIRGNLFTQNAGIIIKTLRHINEPACCDF